MAAALSSSSSSSSSASASLMGATTNPGVMRNSSHHPRQPSAASHRARTGVLSLLHDQARRRRRAASTVAAAAARCHTAVVRASSSEDEDAMRAMREACLKVATDASKIGAGVMLAWVSSISDLLFYVYPFAFRVFIHSLALFALFALFARTLKHSNAQISDEAAYGAAAWYTRARWWWCLQLRRRWREAHEKTVSTRVKGGRLHTRGGACERCLGEERDPGRWTSWGRGGDGGRRCCCCRLFTHGLCTHGNYAKS